MVLYISSRLIVKTFLNRSKYNQNHLLIHSDLTDGGGDIVDAGHSGVLQGHKPLLRAAVQAHWPRLVDKGDGEAGGVAAGHGGAVVVVD